MAPWSVPKGRAASEVLREGRATLGWGEGYELALVGGGFAEE